MYKVAPPTIARITTIVIKFAILITSNFYYATFFNAYSASKLLFAFQIRYIRTLAITAIAISPGTNPAPKLPVVIKVPIWNTKNPIV
jgi:hypothetical protein